MYHDSEKFPAFKPAFDEVLVKGDAIAAGLQKGVLPTRSFEVPNSASRSTEFSDQAVFLPKVLCVRGVFK